MIQITCKRLFCQVILLGVFLPGANVSFGDTISVNADGMGDYSTIQSAIDASSNGDVIELADGVYTGAGNRDLDYHGKLLCVRSASGNPEDCILDCEGQGRGFYFYSDEGLAAKIEGLTVQNGDVFAGSPYGEVYPGYGGAVLCVKGNVTIEHCRFIDNYAGVGGAVSLHCHSDVVFQDCVFIDNAARIAGALYVDTSWLHMYHCEIRRNESWRGGGGIGTYQSDLVLVDVLVSTNATKGRGGGLFNNSTSLLAVDCAFENNSSDYSGGGASLGNGQYSTILINCTCSGNSSGDIGGGFDIYHDVGSIDLIDCVITRNTARSGGGVGICTEYLPVIHNCTIMNNTAEQDGGGVYILPPV